MHWGQPVYIQGKSSVYFKWWQGLQSEERIHHSLHYLCLLSLKTIFVILQWNLYQILFNEISQVFQTLEVFMMNIILWLTFSFVLSHHQYYHKHCRNQSNPC